MVVAASDETDDHYPQPGQDSVPDSCPEAYTTASMQPYGHADHDGEDRGKQQPFGADEQNSAIEMVDQRHEVERNDRDECCQCFCLVRVRDRTAVDSSRLMGAQGVKNLGGLLQFLGVIWAVWDLIIQSRYLGHFATIKAKASAAWWRVLRRLVGVRRRSCLSESLTRELSSAPRRSP